MKISCAALVAALAALGASPCGAEEEDRGPAFRSRVDVGLGGVDEDAFFLLLLEQGFSVDGFGLVLSGPLRFRIFDESPRDEGVLREQDWDEPSDFARIVRIIEYDRSFEDGMISAMGGELNGVGVGHGSIVDHYYNSTDVDHYQGGLLLGGHWAGTGAQLMLENVVDPEIFAGRVFAAPIGWFLEGDWPRRLQFGWSFGLDAGVPSPSGIVPGDNLFVTGWDVALTVLDLAVVEATPYFDMMVMDGEMGIHLGAATAWTLSAKRGVLLHVQGEYRRLGADYHPAVMNPFYERNRRIYAGIDPATGLRYSITEHLNQVDDPVRNGFMAQIGLDWDEKVRFQARYDFQGLGMPHWVLFRLDVTPTERFSLGALYAGQDLAGSTGLFGADALMAASVNAGIWGPFRVFAEFSRRWRRLGASMDWVNESAGGFGLLFSY